MSKVLLLVVLVLVAGLWMRRQPAPTSGSEQAYPVRFSNAEWKAKLSEPAYRILRQEATERAGTSPLDKEKREGDFLCAGCQNLLFVSSDKFDSGTGWPSFVRPATTEAVGTRTDYKMMAPRTEVHCARCGGHLGHVFADGPAPTGKRYCINGGALEFKANGVSLSP